MTEYSFRTGKDFGGYFSEKKWLSQGHTVTSSVRTLSLPPGSQYDWRQDLPFGTSQSCADLVSDFIVGEFSQSTNDGIHSPQIPVLVKDIKDTEDSSCCRAEVLKVRRRKRKEVLSIPEAEHRTWGWRI